MSIGALSLWMKGSGIQALNSQVQIPVTLVPGKRYRVTAHFQYNSGDTLPAKMKIGLGDSGMVTAARTLDVSKTGTSQSADFVYLQKDPAAKARLFLFPLTNNVDYYVDNITISQIDADPLNLAGDKNFGTPTAGPITMDPMMFGITANRWDQTA